MAINAYTTSKNRVKVNRHDRKSLTTTCVTWPQLQIFPTRKPKWRENMLHDRLIVLKSAGKILMDKPLTRCFFLYFIYNRLKLISIINTISLLACGAQAECLSSDRYCAPIYLSPFLGLTPSKEWQYLRNLSKKLPCH